MTPPNHHRVQRQTIELAIGTGVEGPAVHRELARPFWDRALPELERVFDSAAGPRELLRLDRLEINLGRVGGADWTIEFRRRLVAELTRTLEQLTAVSEAGDRNTAGNPPPAEPWQLFLFFLVHGRLPWWGTTPTDGWIEALLEDAEATGWNALRETARADPAARVRLVHSAGDEFLDAAVVNWSGLRHAARVLDLLTPKGIRGDARRRWRRGFWSLVLEWVLAGGFRSPGGGPQLVRDLLALRQMHVPERDRREALQAAWHEGTEEARLIRTEDLPDPWREWLRSQGEARPFQGVTAETRAGRGTVSPRAPAGTGPREGAAPGRIRPPLEDEAIYHGGAGAILLHPFLEQLFRERGLLTGRNFRDVEARDRAVHLLGLLTFGHVDVPEYELVLAKLLCGSAFEEPLEPVQLDDDDIAACDGLLRAVLEHWTALRSSSPGWLRAHFFLRDGKLETVESGYLLTIERRAQDVLLARLPWGCGVVGFPWLKERIFVRWLE